MTDMRPLSASELLTAWERGAGQPPPHRALVLLAAASPDEPVEALACLSIGERNLRLLTLRDWTFGPDLLSTTTCPQCALPIELSVTTQQLRAAPAAAASEHLTVQIGELAVTVRLPNSLDLMSAAAAADVAAARQILLERCVVDVTRKGLPGDMSAIDENVLVRITQEMSTVDPSADLQLALSCPACHLRWDIAFDVSAFFWTEVHAWAQRLVREVHTLAHAYGWREADVLAMSPTRRRLYLDMVEQ